MGESAFLDEKRPFQGPGAESRLRLPTFVCGLAPLAPDGLRVERLDLAVPLLDFDAAKCPLLACLDDLRCLVGQLVQRRLHRHADCEWLPARCALLAAEQHRHSLADDDEQHRRRGHAALLPDDLPSLGLHEPAQGG